MSTDSYLSVRVSCENFHCASEYCVAKNIPISGVKIIGGGGGGGGEGGRGRVPM